MRAYPPNGFGLYDAVGNVWQWTADWYAKDTGGLGDDDGTRGLGGAGEGPASGEHKVARGGSWWCSAGTCHGFGLVTRGKTLPTAPFSNNGFRCALDLPPSPSSTCGGAMRILAVLPAGDASLPTEAPDPCALAPPPPWFDGA